MKRCLTPLALAAAMCMGVAPVAAQEIVTLSTWGTGTLVSDELGLFGTPAGSSVSNLPFLLTVSLDTTGMTREVQPGAAWFQYQEGVSNSLAGEITVNGRTWEWSMVDPRSSFFYSNANNFLDLSTSGSRRESGYDITVYQTLNPDDSGSGTIQSSDYRDPIDFLDVRNSANDNGTVFPAAYFYVTSQIACEACAEGSRRGVSWFVSDQPYSGRWTVSPVPEPSAWLMLAGGLGLLAAARRPRLLASAR